MNIVRAALILVTALVSSGAGARAAEEARRVLLLHSYGPHFAPYDVFSAKFRTELGRGSAEPLDIYEASLEFARWAESGGGDLLTDYLAMLFEDRPPDLVVTFGGLAAQLVEEKRDQLFVDTPLLFTAVEERAAARLSLAPGDVAMALKLDLAAVIRDILTILPETRRVFVVFGDSPNERMWLTRIAPVFAQFEDRLTFEYSSPLSFAETLDRVATLPPDTVVLYGGITIDANGVPHEGNGDLELFAEASAAPVFGIYDYELGNGIVGGPLLPAGGLAPDAAAVAALGMLAGEPPDETVRIFRQNAPTYDARALERWGIDESQLPPDSSILFRAPTVWEMYRWQILAVGAAILVQAGLILSLILSRRRLRNSRTALRRSEERLSLAAGAADLGLWSRDLGTGEIWVSAGSRSMMGLPDGLAPKIRDVIRAIHPGDRSRMLRLVARAVAGEGRFEADCRLSSGGARWVTSRGQVEFAPDGRALRLRGVTTETTARRIAEQMARDLSGRLITAQEEERARLARELHDDLSQRLAVLAIDAGQGEARATDAAGGALLRRIRQGLARLSEDVHALSYRLHPSILADLGLLDALQTECDRFAQSEGIPVSVQSCDLPEDLPAEVALCLYRILQEALHNVARHSGATGVKVGLWRHRGLIHLSITDNGTGFTQAQAPSKPSLGLASMRQRIDHIGGTLDIDSDPGTGTAILVTAQLKEGPLDETARIAG